MIRPPNVVLISGTGEDETIWNCLSSLDWPHAKPRIMLPTTANSIDHLVDETMKFIDEPAIVAGHSLGSLIATSLAARYPERITGLILVSASAHADTPDQADRRNEMLNLLKKGDRGSWVKSFVTSALPGGARNPVSNDVTLMIDCCPTSALLNQQEAVANRKDTHSELKSISCPTCIIGGQFDRITPFNHAKDMHHAISASRLRMVLNTGHFPMLEDSRQFLELFHRALRWISSPLAGYPAQ